MSSENEEQNTPGSDEQTGEREPYTLKEIIEKDRLGQLDDLTTNEVREYAAYSRFKATTEAEINAANQLDAMRTKFEADYRAMRAEFNDKLAQIEKDGILNSFLAEVREIDENTGD